MTRKHRLILKHITQHISDLTEEDLGAINVWTDNNGNELVNIEWSDGVSSFYLDKVLKLIEEKGNVTKADLVDNCLC